MLEWLAELTEEDRVRAIREAFAKVAKTEEGALVFAVLFEQLYFFRPCPDNDSRVLANFAKHLLDYFGEDVHMRMLAAIMRKETHG